MTTYEELCEQAKAWFDSLTLEEQLDHRADQAVSFAFHCAKEFRRKGGTYEEFIAKYAAQLKAKYLNEPR
jgi:hypothetical protein